MPDLINFLMLLCAIIASLAFGMLSAYALCRGAFAMLQMHATSVNAERLDKASAVS